MSAPPWRVFTAPDDLEEGLFGQVVLWTFELLPMLAQRGLHPDWDIRSRLYGQAPEWRVIPGVFDVAAQPDTGGGTGARSGADSVAGRRRDRSLLSLRVAGVSVLGSDWQSLHKLWHQYFRIPERTLARADAVALPPGTLGLHYRGTDKNLATQDTNPVSVDDFLTLAECVLREHPEWHAVFIATDEPAMVEQARLRLAGKRLINLGAVRFHKDPEGEPDRADRALLDCLLLSRCATVLKCSSALSGFAKVLNPQLPCYRVSASKMFADVPYFPDAHVPRLVLRDPRAAAILARQFEGDWLDDPRVPARYRQPFVSLPRHSRLQVLSNWLKFRLSSLLGRPRKA